MLQKRAKAGKKSGYYELYKASKDSISLLNLQAYRTFEALVHGKALRSTSAPHSSFPTVVKASLWR